MKRQQSHWMINYAGILSLLCSFLIGSLVLINVGMHVYKNIVAHNVENFRLRASLSYVATKVRQNDVKNAISVEEHEGVPVLVLREEKESGNYRTMIYCYEGNLMELFQEESMEFELKDGLEVLPVSGFDVKETAPGQLDLVVRNGEETQSLRLSLRSVCE